MEPDVKREPVLEDTRINLEHIVVNCESLLREIEDVHFILDTDVSSNGVPRKCEAPKDGVAPQKNIRFDCAKLSIIAKGLSESCIKEIHLLKGKIKIQK